MPATEFGINERVNMEGKMRRTEGPYTINPSDHIFLKIHLKSCDNDKIIKQ